MKQYDIARPDLFQDFSRKPPDAAIPQVRPPAAVVNADHSPLFQQRSEFRVDDADRRPEGKRTDSELFECRLRKIDFPFKCLLWFCHDKDVMTIRVISDAMTGVQDLSDEIGVFFCISANDKKGCLEPMPGQCV